MNSNRSLTNRGVIGTIILIVVALILLGYFGINFRTIVDSPLVRDNLLYAWELFVNGIVAGWNWLWNFVKDIVPGGQ